MASHFKVSDSLSPRDWRPFHALLSRPSTTVNHAHGWLADHGYSMSRGAVGHYVRHVRGPLRASASAVGHPDLCRRRIVQSLASLSAEQLGLVALLIEQLRNVRPIRQVRQARRLKCPPRSRPACGVRGVRCVKQ